ncbi:DUF2125 domain-containing protein [Bradyrhizobium sp. KBS0727]|uniref:DUF2125 domain-containing protein n=1 Tax=unclassified Bradyrhizobium TaxID=2631580 RepID=UPI00110E83EB|nr:MULTISPECIES: DUF2125 domain-containing protein [unclassified Bradyrhizobium]QDW41167.1 DUF2125 domain-containing protein [Bradyrhizobium sp. KBS0725]QDW47773.1 DUF2125 domain-containing protein [Bradyrhizobium sp. KBS0727]
MPDMTPAPRRRPLWRLFIMPALLVVAAIAWSAFWFYAASEVGVRADAWRAREAKSGRVYDCGKRSVAGYPFRLEVSCDDASVSLVSQTAGAPSAFTARLSEIMVIAQIYQPNLLIADFKAPATIADRGQPPSMTVNWTTGRSSITGLPNNPQRASIVFDNPAIDRVNGPVQTPLAKAGHVELHGRIAEGSSQDHPVIETVLQIAGGTIQEVHPLLAAPFDADIQTKLTGLKDFSPKPWPERFREIQAAGGHVEIVRSRIQQGDLVAIAAGTLSLNTNGRIDGELQMTVAGIEKVIPALGIEKMLEEGVPQATLDRVAPGVKSQDLNNLFGALDKAIPGLGKVVKQNANVGVAAGINSLGTAAELEGKKARAFPLRFVDGVVFFGPIRVAQVPPLF